jgi:predicted MFS family arabinose efflux permease
MGAAGGVVVAFIYPPMIAWLTEDATETSQRLFRFCLSWNAGVICSQMVGGWLFSIRPALPMVAGIVVMAGVLPLLPSPRAARGSPATAPSHPAGAGPGSARAMTFVYLGWLANVGGALAFSLIVHLFPYVAHESGIAPPVHGAMLAGNRLAAVATYVLMYRFPFWQYRLWTALVPQLCAMAGLLLIAFGHSVAILAAGLVLAAFMLGYNYFAGIYYSTVAFGSERKGMASGMHEATLAVGGGVGALGGGLLGSLYGSRAPYKLCVATMLVFVALEIAIYVRSRRAPTAAGAAVG